MITTHEEISGISKKKLALSIALVLVLPYLCLIPYLKFLGYDNSQPEIRTISFWISRILLWLLLGGFILYAAKVEKSKLLIWPEQDHPAGIYVAFFFGTLFSVYLVAALMSVILQKLNLIDESGSEIIKKIFEGNHALIIFTCVTAGITEELLFRGFLQPRLELLTKSRVIAIIGSAFFFALIHFGFGTVQNVIGPLVIGILFAIHYSFFRNIRFLIVFHIIWDLMAIYLLLYLKRG